MSETLIGVIIGGVIASFGTILTILIENNRWKKEKRIEYLKERKLILDESYKNAIKDLHAALIDNNFSVEMVNNFKYQYPDNVAKEFWRIFDDKDKSEENMKNHYWKISKEMKISIIEIDKEIDNIILGKRRRQKKIT